MKLVPIEPPRYAEVKAFVIAAHEEFGIAYNYELDRDLDDFASAYAGGAFFTLIVDDKVVGTVAVRPCGEGEAEIKRVYVRADHRGRGFSRALMDAALDFCRATGFSRLRLDTHRSQLVAQSLYEKYGFTVDRETKNTIHMSRVV